MRSEHISESLGGAEGRIRIDSAAIADAAIISRLMVMMIVVVVVMMMAAAGVNI